MTIEDKKPAVNAQATEAAREKQERIKERFKEWVWSDDSRRERLCRLYNDTFNHTRVRTFNGDHLTLPGASGAIQLHGHQKAGVWRILQTPNTLLAHVVGAGKTYTMVAAAMELKRLGLARKPMFIVPNHMLGQFSTELLTLYPGANILVAGKEDFESQESKEAVQSDRHRELGRRHRHALRLRAHSARAGNAEAVLRGTASRVGNDQAPARRLIQSPSGEGD